jgi:hypothetical protein
MALCPRPAVWMPEGPRTSEIFALLWSDFDWLTNEAFIQRGIVEGYEDETKTESSKRFSARLKCTRPTRFHAPLQRFKNSWTPHWLFREETGRSPAKAIEQLRVESAALDPKTKKIY